ncbi:MAG: mechanosensitive ion channel, partial [Deltaproteobacteria bacterium]|nr:mechanosensitive ion channel [Deltaproteobacteria bacterium]
EIVNVGFRYTTLRTTENHLIMVPNSVIMQNVVTFHGNSESDNKPVVQVDVMLGYDMPPETARLQLLKVLHDEPEVLAAPEPMVRLMSLNDSGITYQLRFYINNPADRIHVQDSIYSQVWYAVNRAGYSFPFPHRQIITAEAKKPFIFSREHIALELRQSELFAVLDDATISSLAELAPVEVFGPGEVVVREGDDGSSLFIVLKGTLEVSVDEAVVGSIHEDSFFGEMSLLTGVPRSATVRASSEVWLAEVTKQLLEPIFVSNPLVLEKLSSILAEREQRTKASQTVEGGAVAAALGQEGYLARLKLFFGL